MRVSKQTDFMDQILTLSSFHFTVGIKTRINMCQLQFNLKLSIFDNRKWYKWKNIFCCTFIATKGNKYLYRLIYIYIFINLILTCF